MNSNTVSENDHSQNGLAKWWANRTFRLACLISLLIFELGFIWFILHFGWLASVNIWMQMGVIFVAVLPLLVAAFFLIRKRFSLTSALVAFTMFAVFMGLTMRPVYEAQQERMLGKLLIDSGARISDAYNTVNFESDVARFEYNQVDKKPLSDWKARMIGGFSKYPLEGEIRSLQIETDAQMEVLAGVADRLDHIEVLHFGPGACADLERLETTIRKTGASQVSIGSYSTPMIPLSDLNWIARCENVQTLSLVNMPNFAQITIQSDDLKLGGLHFATVGLADKFPAEEFFGCKAVRNLKMLTISGFQISNDESLQLAKLTNLKSLSLGSDLLCGIEFLHEMPNLTSARVVSLIMTKDELRNFEIPANLKEFHLSVSSLLISESDVDQFKASAPDGCTVYVTRR
ncbi:hypothetical protein [Mariniblastus fucicola]|uniref:Leucine Rich repeats (2 copies) n=1 Tax=Mariniblastus fucicola TaxID=980251 RepID=A0A5B9PEE4_9BACT|nr:hypothetical protein [Mariniblastus fucicola]QEG23565.1 hypothetical protein MFFC18_34660 [Mariniblastus fucicola]